ncbi:MAG: bifunctional 3-demethylubiquinol 3-O-methyltransferase/2-polyprenyl-6-hydroxyphenol methylase [Gammaproteobacteria bacterium]|nr:bifunctional 3-demethylubiquinol 3-O-methyltransferase/2-polyprenyl-6-hydroxyphenol methylase [Gammaproteobacteria bacterium]|tara:strand:- start:161 stop:850 length:690 start_codon:yes stop_codon:yes gene_type:complete
MNVDKKEIKKFDDISYSWWDPEGPFKPLHMLNPVRTDFIKNRIDLKDKTLIDVGCGGGLLCENLAEHSKEVKGIDMSNEAIEIAKTHQTLKNLKIDYEEIALEALLKKSKKKYDVLTCMELVEHVPDPEKLIKDCFKITNRKADLFFSTLNRNIISYIIAIIGAEYILSILPKGTHKYEKFIKPSEFSKILRSNDLIVEDIKGISFNLLSNKFFESNNTDINYIIHCKK